MAMIYLKPGEIYMGDQPNMISTVLGSCVAITMHHRQTGWSAVCHAVQPVCKLVGLCKQFCHEADRYVDCVIEKMTHAARDRGIRPGTVEVKLFGGSAMMVRKNLSPTTNPGIGELNVTTAIQCLKEKGLRIKVANVGGNFGRKLLFDAASGIVLMKRLHQTPLPGNRKKQGHRAGISRCGEIKKCVF